MVKKFSCTPIGFYHGFEIWQGMFALVLAGYFYPPKVSWVGTLVILKLSYRVSNIGLLKINEPLLYQYGFLNNTLDYQFLQVLFWECWLLCIRAGFKNNQHENHLIPTHRAKGCIFKNTQP
jgi:hypothetical protein